jgi:hypothetical protein
MPPKPLLKHSTVNIPITHPYTRGIVSLICIVKIKQIILTKSKYMVMRSPPYIYE